MLKDIKFRKEEELNDLEEADKLLVFKQKQKRIITQEHRKEFLGLVIDFCQRLEKHFVFLSPKFVALLAMMLARFTKKDQRKRYMTEKEISREIQKILRERREEAEG